MEKKCVFCGKAIETKERIGRRDSCPSCGRDLHSCLQCRFYDVSAYHQCAEPQSEWVSDKEKGNFCDYFEFGKKKEEKSRPEDARSKLEALFKKKG